MSQKPVDKRSPLNTRECLWEAMLELKSFTVKDLTDRTFYHADSIRDYLERLVLAGIAQKTLTQLPGRCIKFAQYAIDPETAPGEPPQLRPDGSGSVRGQGRRNMWRSMRILKTFTPTILAALSSTEKVTVAVAEAEYYCQYLAKAGYVERMEMSPLSYFFRADRYTGPKAPMIQKTLTVWDANTGKPAWQAAPGGDR
jgi:hypothetical protein